MKRLLFRVLRALALAYATVVVFVIVCQRRLIYFPEKLAEPEALARAEREGLAPWRNARGEIIGWRQANPEARHRLVVFHGNAGCAIARSYYTDALQGMDKGAEWEVFLFEYPGYGARNGSPGKESFLTAGRAAIEELLAADARPLFLLGESIGSGTASALAGAMPEKVAGLICVVPFARLQEVAQRRFPFLPVGLLLRDKFDNPAALAKYHGPVAVVVAENDEIVGAAQGRQLHAAYSGPKLLLALPGAGHNSFPIDSNAEWFRTVSAFVLTPTP